MTNKTGQIEIAGQQYIVINDDFDKVTSNGKVAIITAVDGYQYWTSNPLPIKSPEMLFHPELIKLIMENRFDDTKYNLAWIEKELNISVVGFEYADLHSLKVNWVTAGAGFNIVYDDIEKDGNLAEHIIILPTVYLRA